MTKPKLLSQGAYGCVYYPGYECNNDDTTKYVSKLIQKDKYSKNEYKISKKIKKKIKHYENNFVVIEKKCNIKKNNIDSIEDKCSILRKNNKYQLLYSRYIKSIELSEYIYNNDIDSKDVLTIFYNIFLSLDKLTQINIIHMDLHFSNILVKDNIDNIYIIDFGLSLDIDLFFIDKKINTDYLKKYWFSYGTCIGSNWTLEYVFISIMIRENKKLNDENIMSTIKKYYENNKIIKHYLGDKYLDETFNFYKSLANKSNSSNIKYLLEFSHTWDNYKLGSHILSLLVKKDIVNKPIEYLMLLLFHPIPTLRLKNEEIFSILKVMK